MWWPLIKEKLQQIFKRFLEYAIPYFVGILAAIFFTPADLFLAGAPLWLVYPILSIPAFLLLWTELSFNTLGNTILGLVYLASVCGVIFGIASHFRFLRRYRHLGPKLIGFLLGFQGTLAVFIISAASI